MVRHVDLTIVEGQFRVPLLDFVPLLHERYEMKKMILPVAALALALESVCTAASAAECIKGAIVGGVAQHYAGR